MTLAATTALTAFAVIATVLHRSAPWASSKLARLVSLAMILLVLVSASWYRFQDVDHLLFGSDQMVTLMAGIRLHLLPWWNLGAPIRDNFFKSSLMSIHGLGDSAFFYVVVGIFRLLNIPLTEANLFSASAALSMGSLVLFMLLMRRLFGIGPALVVLVLAAWNPPLIRCSPIGYQMTFVVFLQIAALYGYLLHVSKNQWGWSMVAAGLMVLCAGSELFYFGPVLLVLHWACRRSSTPGTTVGWLDPKNLLVWSGYASMLLVNLLIFLKLPPRLDLTLFGHLYLKPSISQSWAPLYSVRTFLAGFDSLIPLSVEGTYLIVGLSLAAILCSSLRRQPFAVFVAVSCFFVAGLTYLMHLTHLFNLMHLLVPSLMVVGLAGSHVMHAVASRWLRPEHSPAGLAGLACALVLVPLVGPWTGKITRVDEIPPAYRCMKAVGYAVRQLGPPKARVMILSDHAFMPLTMEYYLGRSATFAEDGSTSLYTMPDHSERYYPATLAARLGIGRCDFYVDFVQESFLNKPAALTDLASLNLHEVAQVYDEGGLCASMYSPHKTPMMRLTIDEGNAGFDRTYAYWDTLFHDAYVGTFWYFGVNY